MGFLNRISLRTWYFLQAACCAGLMGYALYTQHQLFLDPCPLCIFQRVAFVWIGLWSLVAFIHNPRGRWRVAYAGLSIAGAIAGAAVAGRHLYLQNLPPGEVPECGPGLSYMIETAPFLDVLRTVLLGDGNCAEVQWTFLGMSMPAWTLIWFVGLGVATLYFTTTQIRRERAST